MGNEARNFEPNAQQQATSNAAVGSGISGTIARAKQVITNPKQVWEAIRSENKSIKEVYLTYSIPCAAFLFICQFIGALVWGYSAFGITVRPSIGSALSTGIVGMALHLATLYIAALVLEKLSPRFSGQAALTDAFRLVAYASTPAYVAGVFSLIPGILFIGSLFSLYSIYVFWQGVPAMTAVPAERRLGYSIVSAVLIAIIIIVISVITAGITGGTRLAQLGSSSDIENIDIPGLNIDLKQAEKTVQEFEKIFKTQTDTK